MELNKTVTRNGGREQTLVYNPEGGIVYPEQNDKSLFLTASAFKLRNSFYWNAEETLQILEDLIDENKDFAYKMAVAKFLSEMLGVRLSPVIITTREAMRLKPANRWTNNTPIPEARNLLKTTTVNIYDRPDKIANSLAYAQYHWEEFRSLPPFYKKALRNALERFDAYTLRKFKLKKRQVKMADMIKALRPRPNNDAMAELYAAIIENRPEAAIEKGTVITEVLSDTTKTTEEKKEWVSQNISKIPFNALIRNLRNVDATDENSELLYRRVKKALRVENGLPVVKVANPFDILTAGLNSNNAQFMTMIDLALEEFLSEVELVDDGTKVSILIDVSGSMGFHGHQGVDVASDYLALLMPTLRNADVHLYAFNTRVIDKTDRVALYKRNKPITIRDMAHGDFIPNGGTSLAESVKHVVSIDQPDLLIVMSDEVSWADAGGVNRIFDVGCGVIAINPAPQGRFTVFAPHLPVIKVSSLDAKIFYYIPMMVNFNKFKTWLKNWAFGR